MTQHATISTRTDPRYSAPVIVATFPTAPRGMGYGQAGLILGTAIAFGEAATVDRLVYTSTGDPERLLAAVEAYNRDETLASFVERARLDI